MKRDESNEQTPVPLVYAKDAVLQKSERKLNPLNTDCSVECLDRERDKKKY